MAVDANVIIYERIKEELRAGKGLSKAVADGYKNAYSAIVDGQITTLLTGIVLFVFGSGPVQGFATTLIIGIITSVLTSIFITRIIFDDRIVKGKNITFDSKLTRNFLQNTHVDFIGKKKIAYIVSGALILISIVSIFTKGFTYGVDFTGGRTYVVRFDQPVQAEAVREAAIAEFDGEVNTISKALGEDRYERDHDERRRKNVCDFLLSDEIYVCILEEVSCQLVIECNVLALAYSVIEDDSCDEDRCEDRSDDTDDEGSREALYRT